jgi:hypothetical protein
MGFSTRFDFGLTYGVAILLPLVSGPAAFAADRGLPKGAAQWMALDHCAIYGPGSTSVEGTAACVRIGGHVRVEFGPHSVTYYQETYRLHASATSAAMRTDNLAAFPEPRHLRVNIEDGYGSVYR